MPKKCYCIKCDWKHIWEENNSEYRHTNVKKIMQAYNIILKILTQYLWNCDNNNVSQTGICEIKHKYSYMKTMITGVREPSLYNTACQGERCDPTCVRYTRDQLLAISPARLTPDLTSRLRKLDIGFCLPRKRSRCGGRNLKKGCPQYLLDKL